MRVHAAAALISLAALGYADDAADVLKSEEMLEELRHPLATLSGAVKRKALVFEADVKTIDLKAAPAEARMVMDTGGSRRLWPVGQAGNKRLWQPFLNTVKGFEHFGFYNIRGGFEGEGFRTLFRPLAPAGGFGSCPTACSSV